MRRSGHPIPEPDQSSHTGEPLAPCDRMWNLSHCTVSPAPSGCRNEREESPNQRHSCAPSIANQSKDMHEQVHFERLLKLVASCAHRGQNGLAVVTDSQAPAAM